MRRRPRHIRVRYGHFEFVKLNAKKFDLRDTYHLILTLSWPGFAGLVFGIYLLINLVFAALYMLNAHAIAEMRPGSFFDAFFFSVETLATVGYGHMYPESFYGHLIAFPTVLTVRHRIDKTSPLFGMTPEDFQQRDIRFIASIVGVDTVIVAPVQSFGDYNYEQIEWNRRFVEIYDQNEEGEWTVDYARIDETEDITPIQNLAKEEEESGVRGCLAASCLA